jgi:hypothetical protein
MPYDVPTVAETTRTRSRVTAAGCIFVASLFLGEVAASCSNGYSSGSTPPGQSCSRPTDCGCWQCFCEGVSTPGAARLCVSDKCPTGEEACTTVCGTVARKLVMATAGTIDMCPCAVDADCTPDNICAGGQCVPPCKTSAQCFPGLLCTGGRCQ